MGRTANIARVAFKDTMRKRIMWVLMLFAVVMIVMGVMIETFTLGHESFYDQVEGIESASPVLIQEKMTKDMATSSMALFGMLILIFTAAGQIPEEIESRTIYALLTYPVKRAEYIFGKFLGILTALVVVVVLMSLLMLAALTLRYKAFDVLILKGVYAILLQLAILLSVSIMLSTFTPVNFNMIFCFILFLIGHNTSYVLRLTQSSVSPVLKFIGRAFYSVVPNFEYFNLSGELALRASVSWSYLFSITLYGIIYITIMLSIGVFVFKGRQV